MSQNNFHKTHFRFKYRAWRYWITITEVIYSVCGLLTLNYFKPYNWHINKFGKMVTSEIKERSGIK